MLKCILLLASVVYFSANPHSHLFSSTMKLKCESVDVGKSLPLHIKSTALAQLQMNYITVEGNFYDKDFKVFQDKLDSVEIKVVNGTAVDEKDGNIGCKATVSMELPKEVLAVINVIPGYVPHVARNNGMLKHNMIVWADYPYRVNTGGDISMSEVDGVPDSLVQTSIISVTWNEIIRDYENKPGY